MDEHRALPKPPLARVVAGAAACALAGWLAAWLPWQLARGAGRELASNPVDGMQPITFLLWGTIGVGAGLIAPRQGWRCALATMALFPVVAVAEILRDPTSHNLWPFEFVIYGVETGIPVIAAFLAGRARVWTARATP